MCVLHAAYKKQRDCYGRTEVSDAGFDCYSEYNERLMEISKRSASASTRAVAISICGYIHVGYINFVRPSICLCTHSLLNPTIDNNCAL